MFKDNVKHMDLFTRIRGVGVALGWWLCCSILIIMNIVKT